MDQCDGILKGTLKRMGPLEDGPESLRGKRSGCIEALVRVLGKVYSGNSLSEIRALLQDEVDGAVSRERSLPTKTTLLRTREELLKLRNAGGGT
jgi:hypothetical protein